MAISSIVFWVGAFSDRPDNSNAFDVPLLRQTAGEAPASRCVLVELKLLPQPPLIPDVGSAATEDPGSPEPWGELEKDHLPLTATEENTFRVLQ
ncbi:MAG: hypothetical protein ACQETE_16420 [Bacteroidota bacterium]